MPLSVKAAEPSLRPDASFLFNLSRIWTMGVLNATPDSFYAGSRILPLEPAFHAAQHMIDEGADILDIGGESTRPHALEVSATVELDRVLPLVTTLHERRPDVPLSVDTQKALVARETLAAGASMVNDVSALRADPEMAGVVAQAGCPVVLMHMRGTPRTMQDNPHYDDVIDEVKQFFEERLAFAVRRGIKEDHVLLDPGIGFGKTVEHNMELLKNLSRFRVFGRPILIGVSRKSFIGRLLGGDTTPLPPEERLEGSIAAALWAVKEGASGIRTHDVGPTRRALRLWEGILRS